MIQTPLAALVNHLWQSTLFAAGVGLLTLALRKNRAQTRYILWLAASVKFLIPFSLLVSLGSWFGRSPAAATVPSGFPLTIEQVSQPFIVSASLVMIPSTQASSARLIPVIVLAVWATGFVILVFSWWRRWWQIQAALRQASPLPLPIGVSVMSSPAMIEPGIFGLLRPVLVLPEGISNRLTAPQLEAILAHELCHVRRRDNLAAAIHMVVEAVFWFHPLVWWLGARLIEERERACDEEVVRLGSEPEAYAQGILTICELYLESPLHCVAGVTGANLRKRIEDIMTNRITRKLGAGRKVLLAIAAVLAVAGPIAIGIGSPQLSGQSKTPLAFEVTSVKAYKSNYPIGKGNPELHDAEFLPGGRLSARAPLLYVIASAYNIPLGAPVARITGGPAWLNSPESVYDIQAVAAKGALPDELSPNARTDRMRLMLQALLAERFKLVIRREAKEVPVYALVVGKDGPKLPRADIEEQDCPDTPRDAPATDTACHRFTGGRGRGLHARAVDMSDLVTFVQGWTDRPLIDKTGLKGLYHIVTEPWLPMELASSPPSPGAKQDGGSMADLPTLFTVFERLGLKMEPQTGKVDIYVIDRLEKPTEN